MSLSVIHENNIVTEQNNNEQNDTFPNNFFFDVSISERMIPIHFKIKEKLGC